MKRELTDAEVELLFEAPTCEKCGGLLTPEACGANQAADALWLCDDNFDDETGDICDAPGVTVRQIVERGLRKVGLLPKAAPRAPAQGDQ